MVEGVWVGGKGERGRGGGNVVWRGNPGEWAGWLVGRERGKMDSAVDRDGLLDRWVDANAESRLVWEIVTHSFPPKGTVTLISCSPGSESGKGTQWTSVVIAESTLLAKYRYRYRYLESRFDSARSPSPSLSFRDLGLGPWLS